MKEVANEVQTRFRVRQHQAERNNAQEHTRVFLDASLDRANSQESSSLLPNSVGYGRPLLTTCCMLSLVDDQEVPYYFVELQRSKLKLKYSDARGLPLAFVFPKTLLDRPLRAFVEYWLKSPENEDDEDETSDAHEKKKQKALLEHREKLLHWLSVLGRAPLPESLRNWFFNKLDNGNDRFAAPSRLSPDVIERCRPESANLKKAKPFSSLNLIMVAKCIANTYPGVGPIRDAIVNSFHLPVSPCDIEEANSFCERKNKLYGVHIVRPGTAEDLDRLGFEYSTCDLTFEMLTQSKDDSGLYLKIIDSFSEQQFIVYVKGLFKISDRLLKWTAEYSVQYPWRFIYFEGTDVTWNFPENRDRCVLTRAPPAISSRILNLATLTHLPTFRMRPSHDVSYTEPSSQVRFSEVRDAKSWSDAERAVKLILQEKDGVMNENGSKDFRQFLKPHLTEFNGTVVQVVSPPGGGKSHFSEAISQDNKMQGYLPVMIDGSDDELVFTPLRTILETKIPPNSGLRLLVLDEVHMLTNDQKRELFSWLKLNADRLRTLLIANRMDLYDFELMNSLKLNSQTDAYRDIFLARLPKSILQEFMSLREVKNQKVIFRFFHCARSLFGGEAISLRIVETLDKLIVKNPFPIEEIGAMLLEKLPTISLLSARDFVNCFWACSVRAWEEDTKAAIKAVGAFVQNSPIGVLFQVALLTEKLENNPTFDFPDYVALKLQYAYEVPPAIRFARWIVHVFDCLLHLPNYTAEIQSLLLPEKLFIRVLVDQVGFPFQLEDSSLATTLNSGKAFSWGGDSGSLEELIDAVKHGHSVDWELVKKNNWSQWEVTDSKAFLTLLSACKSPGKVLKALTEKNLCNLMLNSELQDQKDLATAVVKEKIHEKTLTNFNEFWNPYPFAIWMLLLLDHKIKSLDDLKSLIGESEQSALTILSSCFNWADKNAHTINSCAKGLSSQEKSNVIHKILEELGLNLWFDKKIVVTYFTGFFAKLLVAPLTNSDLVREVIANCKEEIPGWDNITKILWRIANGKANSFEVREVWELEEYFSKNQDSGKGLILTKERKIHPNYVAGLLAMEQALPQQIQTLILENLDCIDDLLAPADHAVEKLADQLENFASNNKGLNFPKCKNLDLKEKLQAAYVNCGGRLEEEEVEL